MGPGADERQGLNAFILDVAMALSADSLLNVSSVAREMQRVRLGVRGAVSCDQGSDSEGTVPSGNAGDD